MSRQVKFKFNGLELEAVEGSLVIDAATSNGIEIPHYCYHPELGNPGNCRLCIVEVAGAPKPMASCRLAVKEGMEVSSVSEAAKRAQASSLEQHLVNHPLDCPVCDQAGECGLQDYYMKFGRYESQVREDKLHKRKRVDIGTHVMLDQERCALCISVARASPRKSPKPTSWAFSAAGTASTWIWLPASAYNAYSGNVIDLCPVGALTDKDFRFKVRVWYLEQAPSICPNCSRGCNISVHTSTQRPWHNEGRRLARLKPRYNSEVNGHWLCDEGRFAYKQLDENRLGRIMRLSPYRRELPFEAACDELSVELGNAVAAKGAEGLAVVASGMLSNEDWAAFKQLFVETLGLSKFLFAPEPDQIGEQDALLRRRDKVANLKGRRWAWRRDQVHDLGRA